jgi:hypothetical protein
MSEQNNIEGGIKLEMEITLPVVVDGPAQMENGIVFSVDDAVSHPDFGLGRIVRFGEYEQLGLVAYVDFGNLGHKEIDIYYLEKAGDIRS